MYTTCILNVIKGVNIFCDYDTWYDERNVENFLRICRFFEKMRARR